MGESGLGGWQFAGIHNYSSGLPFQVTYSGLSIPVGFAPNIRPDVVSSNVTLGGASIKYRFHGRHALSESGCIRAASHYAEWSALTTRYGAAVLATATRTSSDAGNVPNE